MCQAVCLGNGQGPSTTDRMRQIKFGKMRSVFDWIIAIPDRLISSFLKSDNFLGESRLVAEFANNRERVEIG